MTHGESIETVSDGQTTFLLPHFNHTKVIRASPFIFKKSYDLRPIFQCEQCLTGSNCNAVQLQPLQQSPLQKIR